MANIIEGGLIPNKEDKFCIVISRFNDFIGSKLLEGALDTFYRSGLDDDNIDVIKVPGAFEIPLCASYAAKSNKYKAIIALGAIIKGNTDHYEYVCAELTKGIANVSLNTNVPILFGVLTTDNLEQAIERAGTKAGNKGAECAKAAIETANVLRKINL